MCLYFSLVHTCIHQSSHRFYYFTDPVNKLGLILHPSRHCKNFAFNEDGSPQLIVKTKKVEDLCRKCAAKEKGKAVERWLRTVETKIECPRDVKIGGKSYGTMNPKGKRLVQQDEYSLSEDAGTLNKINMETEEADELEKPARQWLTEQEAVYFNKILVEVHFPDGSVATLKVPIDRGLGSFCETVRELLGIPRDAKVSMRYSHSFTWEDSRPLEQHQDLERALKTLPEREVLGIELWEGRFVDEENVMDAVSFAVHEERR